MLKQEANHTAAAQSGSEKCSSGASAPGGQSGEGGPGPGGAEEVGKERSHQKGPRDSWAVGRREKGGLGMRVHLLLGTRRQWGHPSEAGKMDGEGRASANQAGLVPGPSKGACFQGTSLGSSSPYQCPA